MIMENVHMQQWHCSCRYDTYIPEAYERLILDAIKGNQQHFVRRDELRASWAIFTPLLQRIDKGQGPKMHTYPYGARGLEAGDKLIKDSGYVRSSEYTWRLQGAPQGSGN
jgi:glucose-6-phosphate 1-dehydrogenase